MKHNIPGMRQVTDEEWADFLIEFPSVRGTARHQNTLDHVRSEDGFHLATVVYHDWPRCENKTYHVTTETIPRLEANHAP